MFSLYQHKLEKVLTGNKYNTQPYLLEKKNLSLIPAIKIYYYTIIKATVRSIHAFFTKIHMN